MWWISKCKVKGDDSSLRGPYELRVVWALACSARLPKTQAKAQGPPAASLQYSTLPVCALSTAVGLSTLSQFAVSLHSNSTRACSSRFTLKNSASPASSLPPPIAPGRPYRIPRLSHRRRECVRDGSRPSAGLLGRRRRSCWPFDSSSPPPEIQRGLRQDPPRPIYQPGPSTHGGDTR